MTGAIGPLIGFRRYHRLRSAAALALVATLALGVTPLHAQNPHPPTDEAMARRLKSLSEELRCLVCQNQTLADSNAELAVDLRNQVQALMTEGKSDAQIKDYLVTRYGDFVLYRPPVQSNTGLLWFGPFALLALGAGIWWSVSRRSRHATGPVPFPNGAAREGRGPGPANARAGSTPSSTGGDAADAVARGRRLLDDARD